MGRDSQRFYDFFYTAHYLVLNKFSVKEGVLFLRDLLLIIRNLLNFDTVQPIIKPNDLISLIKFDYLNFASRSGQGHFFFLKNNYS